MDESKTRASQAERDAFGEHVVDRSRGPSHGIVFVLLIQAAIFGAVVGGHVVARFAL